MRTSIKLPADVELSTTLINALDLEGDGAVSITVESKPQGKFNKVTKITINIPPIGDAIIITPKESLPK